MDFPKGSLQPLTTISIPQSGGARKGKVEEEPGMFKQLMLHAAKNALQKKVIPTKKNKGKSTRRNRRGLRRTLTHKKRSSK